MKKLMTILSFLLISLTVNQSFAISVCVYTTGTPWHNFIYCDGELKNNYLSKNPTAQQNFEASVSATLQNLLKDGYRIDTHAIVPAPEQVYTLHKE